MKKQFHILILSFAFLMTGLFFADNLQAQNKNNMRRFAFLIGANDGGKDRVKLRYSVSDAKSMARVLNDLGGVSKKDLYFLDDPSPDELEEALKILKLQINKIRGDYERIEVLFYYSGHSDSEGLLLGEKKFYYKKLRNMIKGLKADLKISVLDSCSSGAITRLKGGKKRAPFLIDASMKMKGFAFITSSSHDEASQESDKLKGSFFTYYFISGLRGAADNSKDGRVTLNEVYQFAFHETLSRTEKTSAGPQHPGYEIQMSGSGDVVMTDLRSTPVQLIFDKGVFGRISVRNQSGVFVAELQKIPGQRVRLGLEKGKYEVLLERQGRLYLAKLNLKRGKRLFNLKEMKPVKIASYKAKGKKDFRPYVTVPFAFSLLPEISTGYRGSDKKLIYNMELNLVAGQADKLHGVTFGTVFIANEEVQGALFSSVANYNKGWGNGVQFAGVLNFNKKEFEGAQFGGVANYAEVVYGLQAAPVNVVERMEGAQIGVVNIMYGDGSGTQIGVVNIATGKLKGAQIGVVNIAKDVDVPFGLVNIVKDGQLKGTIWYNEMNLVNLGLKMGSKHFYTLLYVGSHIERTIGLSGIGLGGEWKLTKGIKMNIEALYETFYDLENKFKPLTTRGDTPDYLTRLRVGVVWDMGPIDLTAGLSFNWAYPKESSKLKPAGWIKDEVKTEYNSRFWPGFYLGFQF